MKCTKITALFGSLCIPSLPLLALVGLLSNASLASAQPQPIPDWDSRDIGDVGSPGNASSANATFTVSGAGGDIWGTADAFHFVSQPLTFRQGVTIAARVVSQRDTSAYAKAGLMIRSSFYPWSNHVILDVKPDGGVEFMTRSQSRASTRFIAGASQLSPVWLRLTYDAATDTVTGQVSADGTTWTTVGTATLALETPNLSLAGYAGLAVTSHDKAVLNEAVFDNVQISLTSYTTLPVPWLQTDVGTTGKPGHASYLNGRFSVSGQGADIWGAADSFHYVYTQAGGDGQIVARVTTVMDTGPYAKAGVMIRQTLDAGSADVVLDIKPDGGVEFMSRVVSGGDTQFMAGASQSPPGWLKLAWSGGIVSGYVSVDGATWKKVGEVSTTLGSPVYVGLAVTSHDMSWENSSTFDNVLIDWSSEDIGDVGIAGSADQADGKYLVKAAGSDIWGTADAFRYVYLPLGSTSVSTITVRIDGVFETDQHAKAGIMIRDSLAADAANVILDVEPNGSVEFMGRGATGNSTTFVAGAATGFPAFLRLTRSGNSFSGYVCTPDAVCSLVGTTSASVSPNGLIGLAVTSHNLHQATTVVFGRVTVDP